MLLYFQIMAGDLCEVKCLYAVEAGILASLAGIGLLVLHNRYPATIAGLFLLDDSQREDTSRQLYNYSPGPLKIDTVRLFASYMLSVI